VALSSDDSAASSASSAFSGRVAIDRSLRQSVLLFIGSALGWLLLATALRLLNSIEALFPACFGGFAWLSYGRIEAASRMAAVFGWASLGGYGAAFWILARLSGTALPGWGRSFLLAAAAAWNAALLAGVAGILCGAATGVQGLELPPRAGGVLFSAQLLLAVLGIWLGSTRRGEDGGSPRPIYISQAYLLAALIWFPLLFGLSETALVRDGGAAGSAQAAALAWFGGSLFELWVVPLGLGILYYLVPKLLGKPVASGAAAWLGFWSLALLGGWGGAARLTGGTAPAWVASAGIAAHVAILVPVLAVALTLLPLLGGRLGSLALAASPVLRCAGAALAAFLAVRVEGFLTGFRSVGDLVRFTYWEEARAAVGFDLFLSLALFGAIYFIAPRLAGWEWPSLRLIRVHFWGFCLGATLLAGALAMGGLIGGLGLADAQVPFAAIGSMTGPFLWARSAALLLLLGAEAAFVLHFVLLIRQAGSRRTGPTLFAVGPHILVP